MPAKRCITWYSNDVPQSLQNWLYSHQYSTVADVTIGEGIVERVISRNTIIIALEDDSEVQIKLYKVNHENEPYNWEAKQALHQMLANQRVYFISLAEEHPNTLLADVHLPSGQSATEMLIKYGLATLQHCPQLPKKELKYLTEVENKARTAKRGIWSLDHQKPGPENLYINELLFKQIECDVYKIENESIHMVTTPGNFCIVITIPGSRNVRKAKKQEMIARKHLLYNRVKVELQNYDISVNRFIGRIIYPQLAGMNNALWKNRKRGITSAMQRSTFTACVIEVLNGNSFTLRFRNRVIKNVFLSYIIFPWQCGNMKHLCSENIQNLKLVSMYYTHRLRLYTREFLRTLLVGSSVEVTVDYLDSSKGIYCTMTVFKMNVASLLIEKGYAYVDIDHSVCPYREEYLAAENKAKECEVGMHVSSPQLHIDIAWCMDNVLQLLSILERQQNAVVVVEQVLSPSYIILFSVELGWLFAFSLIDFEEVRRANTGISKKNWKEKVTRMIAEMCLQKEVSLQATSVDSNGVLHGNLKMGSRNLRKLLLRKTGNRFSALGPQRRCRTVLDNRRNRIKKKYYKYISSRHDEALMRRIKQGLRRDVKTLATLPFSWSPSSPYFISNRKKKKRMTMHVEQRCWKVMTLKLDNMQEKKRGHVRKKKEKAPKEKSMNQQTEKQNIKKKEKAANERSINQQTEKQNLKKKEKTRKEKNIKQQTEKQNLKKKEKAQKEKSINQQTEKQNIIERKSGTVQREQPKKNNQMKVVFKKWKDVENKATLRWCCF